MARAGFTISMPTGKIESVGIEHMSVRLSFAATYEKWLSEHQPQIHSYFPVILTRCYIHLV